MTSTLPRQATATARPPSSWTAWLRSRIVRLVPPGEALPDRQPVYVTSWIYVFGVLTIAGLVVVLVSGGLLAVGGAAWWHVSAVGHYVNSLHLWGVELFFATMVIHLWGTFWMAAWRGRRTLTWVVGVVAFVTSIGTAFTGYLSQSNFDAQWISTQAKDGLNSIGFGAWFNVLNPGQMLLWHVVLLPSAIGVIVLVHVVLVRRHGVVPPIDAAAPSEAAPERVQRGLTPDAHRFRTRPYDLVKEFVAALVVMTLLTAGLAGVFSSPDEPAITMQRWAQEAPGDVVATATGELAGTTASATYGPPYNRNGSGQSLLGVPLQKWGGVRLPVSSASLVLQPLAAVRDDPALAHALASWQAATPATQSGWADAYANALSKAPGGDPAQAVAGSYGPVPVIANGLLTLARSGGLEGALTSSGSFYGGDQTRSLLLLSDGAYLEDVARAQRLGGDQWGMMNETGNYPGQPWMWLYTFWYQVKPFSTSENADALVWGLMMLLTLALMFLPLIPGLRSIPRWVPVHRLIWRDYYRRQPLR
ncbi:MAG TPA: cytochrome b N-terminal domain-containing protein [Actinomycetales bacterium]|nr:cytochrome b N-terminal domain-containing protein [Actinomycetales bacterium]